MPIAATPERTSETQPPDAEVTPKFIVDLTRPPGKYPGVIKIEAENTYATRYDIQRWLAQCLRELEDELRRMDSAGHV